MAATVFRVTGLVARSDAATAVLLAAASCAFTRSALSERDEYCATTMAVETAATTANAAPSHQRPPRTGGAGPPAHAEEAAGHTERLRRERTQRGHAIRDPAGGMPRADAFRE